MRPERVRVAERSSAGIDHQTRVLARTFTLLEAAQYGPLRDFYGKVVSADRQQVVLNAASAGAGQ